MKNLIKKILVEETGGGYSGVEGYLQALAQMTSGKQKEYYDFMVEKLTKVNTGSYRDSKVLTYHVDKLRREMPKTETFCQKKGCYDTAVNLSVRTHDIDINYVEGWVESIIPINHAWNYYEPENIHFDLINDVAWEGEESHFNEYFEILNFGRYELMEALNLTGYAGGFLNDGRFVHHFINYLS